MGRDHRCHAEVPMANGECALGRPASAKNEAVPGAPGAVERDCCAAAA